MQATLSTPVDTPALRQDASKPRSASAGTSTATSSAAASFDLAQEFLPDGLSLVDELDVPEPRPSARFLGQVQGRTYANMFGLVERFIGAKMLEVGRDHALGDQTALEAIVRFTDEELKHQELFRRVELLVAAGMPRGLPLRVAGRTTSPRSCSASAPGPCSR